jgi:ABC-type branched-subunit amino acid transport system substrate-binding protein
MNRPGPATESALGSLGVILAVGVLLSVLSVVPSKTAVQVNVAGPAAVTADPGSQATEAPTTVGPSGAAASGRQTGTGPGAAAAGGGSAVRGGGGAACSAGHNGGSTDVGVSGNEIKLAATVVDDGPGASFLSDVRIGMAAVLDEVNRAGGICGRRLDLELRNDSWDAATGKQYIQNFVQSDRVFALAVVPSSEGLRAADSYIAQQGVPVVGTDGMLIHQYKNPWIWPVATSTISTMHVMAKSAYDAGARNFSIVFDAKYRFGVEGAFAFNAAVKRLTGADIPGFDSSLKTCQHRFCGIQPGQSSYATQARGFNNECYQLAGAGKACDFTAYLLEPDTAVAWLREGRDAVTPMGGAQPLFSQSFAQACGKACDGMQVWTGYRPPLGSFAGLPAEDRYLKAIRGQSSTADPTNQFLEGGYVGMRLLVDALTAVGPDLTRANLRAQLDRLTFDSGLSQTLNWRAGNHFANASANGFSIDYKQNFNGFRATTPFVTDPWVGQDERQ